jgi:hypothetical protein
MNTLTIIGSIWVCISVWNYMVFIPQDQKKKTGFIAFIGFAIVSPIVTIVVYIVHYLELFIQFVTRT